MNKPLFVIATVTANPEQAPAVRAAIEAVLAPSRLEEGCLRYDLLLDNSNNHRFVIQEQWTSKDALNLHMQTEHFKTLVAQISPLAAVELDELSLLA